MTAFLSQSPRSADTSSADGRMGMAETRRFLRWRGGSPRASPKLSPITCPEILPSNPGDRP